MTTVRGLALSGGGSKIAFQVGVIERLLLDGGNKWDVVGGTSCGALAASMIAQGDTWVTQLQFCSRMRDIVSGIKNNDSIYKSGNWLSKATRLFRTGAMFDPKPLDRIITDQVSLHNLRRSATAYRIGVVDVVSGRHYVVGNQFDPGVDLMVSHPLIMASGSMPCFFPAITHLGMELVDGGVRDMTPLRAVIDALKLRPASAYHLDIVLCSPIEPSLLIQAAKPRDPIWLAPRSLSLLENEAFRSDVREILYRNQRPAPGDVPIHLRVFAPVQVRQGTLEFDPEKLRLLMEHGRQRSLSPYEGTELEDALL